MSAAPGRDDTTGAADERWFRKTALVEARQLTNDNGGEIARWCFGTLRGGPGGGSKGGTVIIDTLEGRLIASPGDWVLRGPRGEFWPCRQDIFDETYEPVEAPR